MVWQRVLRESGKAEMGADVRHCLCCASNFFELLFPLLWLATAGLVLGRSLCSLTF